MRRGWPFLFVSIALCACTVHREDKPIEEAILTPVLLSFLASLPQPYVIIAVWSPFCHACGGEVRHFNRLQSKHVGVVGIPVASRRREIDLFIEHFKPRYRQWFPNARFRSQASAIGQVPWGMLVDHQRHIVDRWYGELPQRVVQRIKKRRGPKTPPHYNNAPI